MAEESYKQKEVTGNLVCIKREGDGREGERKGRSTWPGRMQGRGLQGNSKPGASPGRKVGTWRLRAEQ